MGGWKGRGWEGRSREGGRQRGREGRREGGRERGRERGREGGRGREGIGVGGMRVDQHRRCRKLLGVACGSDRLDKPRWPGR